MPNPIRGEVPLKLGDGREFVLVLDFDMRVAVEDLCDKPFAEVAARAMAGFNGAVRALVWGALRRHHASMTLDDVSDLVENHGGEVEAALVRAAKAANPPEPEGGKESANPPTSQRGKLSGGSGAKRG